MSLSILSQPRASAINTLHTRGILVCVRGTSSQATREPPRLHRLVNKIWHPPPPLVSHQDSQQLLRGLRIRIKGIISVFRDEQHIAAWRKMPKAAFYAVKMGREPGIYSTWTECENQVKGYTAAKYKKFGTKAEAEAFIGDTSSSCPTARPTTSGHRFTAKEPAQARFELASSSTSASALTLAGPSSLPPHLAEIAKKGFSFTTAPHHLIVYTDGSALGNGRVGSRAGLGVYYGWDKEAEDCNISERVPGQLQTNNRGELLSVVRTLEECPYPDLPLEVRTDSQYTIKCVTEWLPAWMAKNFAGVKNADMIKHMLVLLRQRSVHNKVRFVYVAGHTGEIGNEAADALARRGAVRDPLPDRSVWLDPDTADMSNVSEISEIEVEVDESWLLTEEDLADLEKDFK